ncbi:unannotated protein [freshwater metagenome]|jgi:hypothetical protein|uniref:Unannotated protein n=1 Tax=freshwater metagenome TaxID=449393 RepID=A0A6J7NWC5_9ZZZZ|nr:hypothetical protein [Actinomycetota bacterium]MSY14570.1 hypothetical protein [Actinomycetota bacterium]
MDKVRAEILSLGLPRTTAARIVIAAPAQQIFDLLADPRCHSLFDGSGTLQGSISGPVRLYLGAKFGMAMKIKVPYRITNTVVAFDEGRNISWCHLMKWTWNYELVDLGNGKTQVTEKFDATDIPWFAAKWLNATGALERNPKWMAKSLVQLKAICES